MTKQRIDLYQTVTDQIIAALDAGTPPWARPWIGEGNAVPTNLATGRAYRGINVLLLNLQSMAQGFVSNRWMTFHQAQALGGHIRRGEHGTGIVFFKMLEVSDMGKPNVKPAHSDDDRRVVPLLRSFTVFNVAQIDGIHSDISEGSSTLAWLGIRSADEIIEQSGATIKHGGSRAFYQPTNDFIGLPDHAAFHSASDYYATALHELTHWTGHASRCNRILGQRHGIEAYAFEELVAEMGAGFLCAHCGVSGQLQHASYIASWLEALRNDKRLIFTAASQAQKAVDFLLPEPSAEPNPAKVALEAA